MVCRISSVAVTAQQYCPCFGQASLVVHHHNVPTGTLGHASPFASRETTIAHVGSSPTRHVYDRNDRKQGIILPVNFFL